ncbi:MAG: hypothetical protein FJ109_15245, partial [Deltaproteobacteria bacterium]|nr:hypothetical protein [Deltaproteobacteria bacterium]
MSRFHPYLGAALLLACACGGNTAQTPAEVKDESWWQGHDGNGTGEEAGRADLGPADAIAPEASSPDVPIP